MGSPVYSDSNDDILVKYEITKSSEYLSRDNKTKQNKNKHQTWRNIIHNK